jgi:hypothetical protein
MTIYVILYLSITFFFCTNIITLKINFIFIKQFNYMALIDL